MEGRDGAAASSAPHAVLFPFAAVGHVRPLLQLARRLAHVYGFRVTVVTTSFIYRKLNLAHALVGGDSGDNNIQFIDLEEGFPSSYYTIATLKTLISALSTLKPNLHRLLHRLHTETPVTCVISDVVFEEAHRAALHHGIPSVAFSTQCAMAMAAKYFGRRLVDEGHLPLPNPTPTSTLTKTVSSIPGLIPMQLQDFYSGLLVTDTTDPFFQFVVEEQSTSLHQRDWILSNSVLELETAVVDAFRRDAGIDVTTIGPLAIVDDDDNNSVISDDPGVAPPLLLAGSSDGGIRSSYWPEETRCMDWLGKQARQSVVYVSFGSLAVVQAKVVEEILLGIEESGVPFLVVMRHDGVEGNVAVEEMEARTRDRGLFVSWAPQMAVLRHGAIAGFLTHCGWNSFLESVSSGVPLLCHPFFLDQPMISRYIVSVWKTGLEFQRRADGSLDRKDVVEKLKALAADGSEIRANARAWRAVARASVELGGSSNANLVAFVADMYRRVGAVMS